MFLQRLVEDNSTKGAPSLNYDYMGSAEFEFGVTGEARIALATLVVDGQLVGEQVRFFTKWGRSTYGPVDVFVFGERSVLDNLIKRAPVSGVPGDLLVTCDKENARADDDRYVGWLSVSPHGRGNPPVLILRATEENKVRGNEYLNFMVRQILEARKEKADA